jgi:hypothetical protein
MKPTKIYQHADTLGTPLIPGQVVCWSTSWTKGIRLGIVENLTKQRVRIRYRYEWKPHNAEHTKWYDTSILAQPNRILIINEQTPASITMHLMRQG